MLDNKLLKGKIVADTITERAIEDVKYIKSNGIKPLLAMLKVGHKFDDEAYERAAKKRCSKCDIETRVVELDENCTQEEYIEALESLNKDSSVHGILCFRPLPKHIDEEIIEKIIDPQKDVDCFSPMNMAKVMFGDDAAYPPCTAMGVVEILKYYNIDLRGKKIAVLGRSLVVGKPLSILLINRDATVTVCHSKTKNIEEITKNSDIIVSCMGRAKMIDKKFINNKSIVIDVGINFDDEGNMCGDVDMDSVIDTVAQITPVPGGVGSVTTSVLISHLVKACKNINNL